MFLYFYLGLGIMHKAKMTITGTIEIFKLELCQLIGPSTNINNNHRPLCTMS